MHRPPAVLDDARVIEYAVADTSIELADQPIEKSSAVAGLFSVQALRVTQAVTLSASSLKSLI